MNWSVVGFGIALACSGTLLLVLQSHLTFFGDDWSLLLGRQGSSPTVYLDPHNDHVVVLPVAIYKALLSTFGMDSAVPFQVVGTLVFLLGAAAIFLYLRRRVGGELAFLGATLILFLGAAWIDLLWPIQVALSGSIASGILALLALERDDARGDWIACVLLVVSTAFSELGISFALAAVISIALGPAPRRNRLFVVLVPFALYAIWFLGWGHKGPETLTLHNVLVSPKYVFEAISQSIASLLGLATPLTGSGSRPVGLVWGELLFLILGGLAIWRMTRAGRVSRGLATALALGGSFWFFAAFNAYLDWRTPTNGRYQYPGAVFVLLIAAELLRGYRPDRRVLAAAATVTAAAVVSGIVFLHDGSRLQKDESNLVRARLAALEIARPRVRPDTTLTLETLNPINTTSYFSAVDAYGSPAFSQSQLSSSAEADREAADQALTYLVGIRQQAAPPSASTGHGETCRHVQETASVPLTPGTYTLLGSREPTNVRLARFAEQPSVNLGALQPGQRSSLEIPPDLSTRPWRLALVGSQPVLLCGAA